MAEEFKTSCPYCGVGCGVIASRGDDGEVSIKGDPDHPANFGALCSKGMRLADTIDFDGRLLAPSLGRGDKAKDTDWDTALSLVADEFTNAINRYGSDSVAFYGSGQLLTEDYYIANKLMKGYIGSGNLDTNSRLCMASSVAGHKRAFGTDTVPGCYSDLEEADLIILVGSNLSWCHPILARRIEKARQKNPELKVILVDPRETASATLADTHLAIAPGSDVALFNGVLCYLADNQKLNNDYISYFTSGFDEALEAARADKNIAHITGLSEAELTSFYEAIAHTPKMVTIYSQGVNQSHAGADKVNAIINIHLATGRIGQKGMGPFSVTGQPNAMGGREVGGLANMLAAHLDFENDAHRRAVSDFWNAPNLAQKPGLKAADMFRAVSEGKIKAIWIMATNPAVSMAEAKMVKQALADCPFVVVSDIMATTDTSIYADVRLPAYGWAEKEGMVTNSERRLTRQRAFVTPPEQAKADWQILCEVAQKMGFSEGFSYENPAQIFNEHASLSQLSVKFERDFDLTGLMDMSAADYEAFTPIQWPVSANSANANAEKRFFAKGGFFTPNKRGQFISVRYRALAEPTTSHYPMRLNSGRVRDHWHTMTRTGKSAHLSQHIAEPFCEIHPEAAANLAIDDAGLIELKNSHGSAVLRAQITSKVRVGELFVPMHWTEQFSGNATIGSLIPAITDPISGQPELKGAVVSVKPIYPEVFGFVVSSMPLDMKGVYWAKSKIENGWRAELAEMTAPDNWEDYLYDILNITDEKDALEFIQIIDEAKGVKRLAMLKDNHVIAALFTAKEPVFLARDFIISSFQDDASQPLSLLAGKPAEGRVSQGAIICSCFNIGVNSIITAITDKSLTSVDEIGTALQAGTNCGSCRSELNSILKDCQTTSKIQNQKDVA